MTAVWGNLFDRVFFLNQANSLAELQQKGDLLLSQMEADPAANLLEQSFLPSMMFPGALRRAENLEAWKGFWTPQRIADLEATLGTMGAKHGFSPQAFAAFLRCVAHPVAHQLTLDQGTIPENFFPLLGVARDAQKNTFRQFSSLALPEDYPRDRFFNRYQASAAIFDPALFSRQLGELMFTTFSQLIYIITPAVFVLMLIFFFDFTLAVISMAPVVFAMVCTLGTLTLMGRSLDIPSLMLAIIVLGMGIDYALFMVRSYQRYGRADHPGFTLIRSAVIMAAASTLIGFGVLAFARHSLLQSAGLTSLLGIGYSAMGAFLLLPPLLRWRFGSPGHEVSASLDVASRVYRRYAVMEPYVRFFARFKMRLDPLFRELDGLLDDESAPRTILDIGSGYGVPTCWLAETFPSSQIYGIEPDPNRVRVASRALGTNGLISIGKAPEIPQAPPSADAAFMLDMMHYLSDNDFELVLRRLHDALKIGGLLIIRASMVPVRRAAWYYWYETIKGRMGGLPTHYRSRDQIQIFLDQYGFKVQEILPSGPHQEMVWFRAENQPASDQELKGQS
jgi:precorrin-6B methylase 2